MRPSRATQMVTDPTPSPASQLPQWAVQDSDYVNDTNLVGAGLPAMRPPLAKQMATDPTPSLASQLPQEAAQDSDYVTDTNHVGAGLPAMRPSLATQMMTGPAPSLASQLPQGHALSWISCRSPDSAPASVQSRSALAPCARCNSRPDPYRPCLPQNTVPADARSTSR